MHPNAVISQEALKKEYGSCILFVVAEGYMFQVPQKAPKGPLMHVEPFDCPKAEEVLKNVKNIISPKKTGKKPTKGKSSGRGKSKRKEEAKEADTAL